MKRSRPLAIVLAAGAGRRLGMPTAKPLLPLPEMPPGHGSFLERHLALLGEHGCDALVVVPQADRTLYTFIEGPGIALVGNPHSPAVCGSTMSLAVALDAAAAHELLGDRDLLVLDCDIVYERRLIAQALAERRTCLFVMPSPSRDQEQVRVFGQNDRPVLIGKALPPAVTGGLEDMGESVGLIRVAAGDAGLLGAMTRWLVGRPPGEPACGFSKQMSEHEEVWQYFCALGRMTVCRLAPDQVFSECDTAPDYEQIVTRTLPLIRRRDAVASDPTKQRG